jgi:hypothetical protein
MRHVLGTLLIASASLAFAPDARAAWWRCNLKGMKSVEVRDDWDIRSGWKGHVFAGERDGQKFYIRRQPKKYPMVVGTKAHAVATFPPLDTGVATDPGVKGGAGDTIRVPTVCRLMSTSTHG